MNIEFTSEQKLVGTITLSIEQILSLEAIMYKIYEEGTKDDSEFTLDQEDWHTVHLLTKTIGESNLHSLTNGK